MKRVLLVASLFLLTGCDRILAGKVSTVRAHEFPDHGVVCYTFVQDVSCVKVKP